MEEGGLLWKPFSPTPLPPSSSEQGSKGLGAGAQRPSLLWETDQEDSASWGWGVGGGVPLAVEGSPWSVRAWRSTPFPPALYVEPLGLPGGLSCL